LGSGPLNPAVGTFIGYVLSVALTTWPLIPLAVWAFHPWLFPENQPRWLVAIMPVLLVLAYLIEIALLWNLV
jgi:antibiotic biosynthesis monooxygenase (ABM) superfamily enzyme